MAQNSSLIQPGLQPGLQTPAAGTAASQPAGTGLPPLSPQEQTQLNQLLSALGSMPGTGQSGQTGTAPGLTPPLGEDMFGGSNSLMPEPKYLLAGGGAALLAALGLNHFFDTDAVIKSARLVNNIPGLSGLGKAIDSRLISLAGKPGWLNETFMPELLGGNAKNFAKTPDEAAAKIAEKIEKSEIEKWSSKLRSKEAIEEFNKIRSNLKIPGSDGLRNHIDALSQRVSDLDAEAKRLDKKDPIQKAQRKALEKTVKSLKGLRDKLQGVADHHIPVIQAQAKLLHRLDEKGVGFFGRTFAKGMHYVSRIFNGQAMAEGMGLMKNKGTEKVIKGFFNKARLLPLAMAFLGGGFILGQTISKVAKAKEGEKVQTGMHDFWGMVIGQFVGWEVGRKFLHTTGIISKLFGRFSHIHPLRGLPIAGKWTLPGIILELVAMFGIGGLFQKIGEKFSHAIFGKPSEASLNPGSVKQAPNLPATADGQPLNRKHSFSDAFTRMPAPASVPADNTASPVPAASGPASSTAAPTSPEMETPSGLSIRPEDISINPAAERATQEANTILNSMNGSGGH